MIKLQHLSVIFIIIMLPLIMVLSVYISTQIDTMQLQTVYSSKLTDATHDAIIAFQLNTRNNEYSTVSDSLKRDVAASINTFFTSLAQNMGLNGYAEKELQPYIPAVVCALYDGYYIYSPTKTGTGAEDIQNILKQYIYYTAEYIGPNGMDLVINYSLDSHISVYGKTAQTGEKVARSGYLIKYGNGNGEDSGLTKIKLKDKAEMDAGSIYVYSPDEPLKDSVIGIKDGGVWNGENPIQVEYVIYNDKKIEDETNIVAKDEKNQYIDVKSPDNNKNALYYYIEALEFSRYINETVELNRKIGTSTEIKINGTDYLSKLNKNNVFDIKSVDPENIQSNFVNHKREIIKLNIENNLQIAFNNYVGGSSTYGYQLPKLSDEDWEKVYQNVSMITFMQGLQVGNKVFNDYAIVTSTGNEEYIDPEGLYFIQGNEYHTIDCEKLKDIETGYKSSMYLQQNRIIDQTGKDIVHDEDGKRVEDKSGYILKDIQGKTLTACYKCIIESGGKTLYGSDGNLNIKDEKKKQYYTILARERYNLMKLKPTRILNSSKLTVQPN